MPMFGPVAMAYVCLPLPLWDFGPLRLVVFMN